jgi:hypothetical protein
MNELIVADIVRVIGEKRFGEAGLGRRVRHSLVPAFPNFKDSIDSARVTPCIEIEEKVRMTDPAIDVEIPPQRL